jgi:putative copper export protein
VTEVVGAVTGWLLFGALVFTIGSCAGRWLLVPRVRPAISGFLATEAARLGLLGASLLPLAIALVFVRQLLEFHDPFAPWSEDAAFLLTGTRWGDSWLMAAVGSIVALLAFVAARAGARIGWLVATPMVVGLSTFPAFTGHAAGAGSLREVMLTADTLHVLSAGGWLGGLAFILWAERRFRRVEEGGTLLPELVPLFSPVAVVGVTALLITGSLSGWVQVGTLGALVSTTYGRMLLLKVSLVGVVLGLGALNWRRLTPRLRSPEGAHALRRAASIELLIGQIVLLVTAILVRTSPLGH